MFLQEIGWSFGRWILEVGSRMSDVEFGITDEQFNRRTIGQMTFKY